MRRVEPESAAAAAGIRIGDIVVSVNGSPIEGRDGSEIVRKDFKGPIGDAVRLSVAKLDGNRSEIVVTRKAYPPHLNPQSDPFSYVIPGSWQTDLRYQFPLPWSPAISYQRFEDLAFAPDFDDPSSLEYHSYLIVWWPQWRAAAHRERASDQYGRLLPGLGPFRAPSVSMTDAVT